MQDILLQVDDTGLYDIAIDGADFASVDGFETAIVVSLFSDARAAENQVQDAFKRRGFIGDILTIDQGRVLGSLLWLLDQTRLTEDTVNNGRVFATDAFQWMIDDGIIKNSTVTVTRTGIDEIIIQIVFIDQENKSSTYTTLWRATDAANLSSI